MFLPPRGFFDSFMSLSRGSWSPPVDIIDSDVAVVIHADLPEVKKEDMKVYTENTSTLCISGIRAAPVSEHPNAIYLIEERGHGRFERCFDFGAMRLDLDNIKAKHENQLLTVTVPKQTSTSKSHSSAVNIE